MTIAIDLDQTFTKYPAVFSLLGRALVKDGHEVVILTAVPGGEKSRMNRLELLDQAGITSDCYSAMVCVETGEQKGAWCLAHNAAALFDDTLSYCEATRRISPSTACLHLLP